MRRDAAPAPRWLLCALAVIALTPRADGQRTVRLGLHDAHPLAFADPESGQPSGFAVEVFAHVAELEDWDPVYVEGTWSECMERLAAGEIDLLFPILETAERRELFDFNEVPMLVTLGRVFAPSAGDMQGFQDLEGAVVSVVRDDIFASELRSVLAALGVATAFEERETVDDVFRCVAEGVADVAAVDGLAGRLAMESYGLEPTSLFFLPAPMRVATAAGTNGEVLAALDRRLDALRRTEDSVYHHARERWLGPVRTERVNRYLVLGLLAAGGLLLTLTAVSWAMRLQVRARTREIAARNRELQQEVADRRRAEAALRESEQRARAVIENMPVMMNATDEDGLFVAWNKECERVTGYSAEEIIGNPDAIERLYPDPEYRAQILCEVADRAQDYLGWERRYVAKDGTERIISRSSISRRFPIPGWASWGIGVDVTERKRAEEALRQGEARLRLITDALPVLIAYLDDEQRYRFCNATYERWFDRPTSGIVGCTLAELLGPVRYAVVAGRVRAALDGEEQSFDATMPLDDGSDQHVHVVYVPHRDAEGRVAGIYELVSDTTQRRRAEAERARLQEQLRQSQKLEAMGRLASGMAHDFRNLLTVIAAHVEQAQGAPRVPAEVEEALDVVSEAVDQGSNLTRSLLTFGRRIDRHPMRLDLAAVLRETIHVLRRLLPAAIRVDAELPDGPLWVDGDETHLRQVMLNLVLNARDAMPDGGTLVVRLGECTDDDHGRAARLTVSDTGQGMTPEVAARVFEPFFTTKPRGQGTGLGLAVVHGIVKEHDGSIGLDTVPGQGTSFTIVLPKTPGPPDAPAGEPDGDFPRGHGETILVGEDNLQIRQVVTASLIDAGYHVIQAPDGEAAIGHIRATDTALDLCVLDVDMPGASGLEALDALRRRDHRLPAILVTGSSGDGPEGELDEATVVLHKPFRVAHLGGMVRRLLDAQRPGDTPALPRPDAPRPPEVPS